MPPEIVVLSMQQRPGRGEVEALAYLTGYVMTFTLSVYQSTVQTGPCCVNELGIWDVCLLQPSFGRIGLGRWVTTAKQRGKSNAFAPYILESHAAMKTNL